ncbi:MAG: PQQ-binding-like beta-propeller repeat protein, partial [Candidatus Poribacteria bacterium]|nr:PQQ-binding-like beta-propeller repeat protein [Candidatus Poribacteria bacterium]
MTKGKTGLIVHLTFFCMCCCIAYPQCLGAAEDIQPNDLHMRNSGCDWPGFLGPTGDGKSPETGLRLPWRQSGPSVVWHKQLGAGYAAPSVAKGRLFTFDRHGNKARLTCMRSETAEELWRFEYPTDYRDMYGYSNGPRACPVVDDDRVYVYGAEGMLHCVGVLDGELIWKVNTANRFNVVQNFFGVASAPVVERNLLIVQVGGSPPGSPKDVYEARGQLSGNGTGIVAFDKFTGEVIYKITDELASYASPSVASINGRRWCFMFARGGLGGFEPHTGKVDFQYPWRSKKLESVNASNPVVAGDLVFISEAYGVGSSLLKVRPSGYQVVWKDAPRRRDKSMMLHWNTAIHYDGYVYGCSGRHAQGSELRCVKLESGEVMWSLRTDERATLLYVDGYFVGLGEYGTLMLIRANPKKPEVVSRV